MDQLPFTIANIEVFFLMLVRVTTIIAIMPVLGASAIPAQVKVALSLFLTIVLFSANGGLGGTVGLDEHSSAPWLVLLVVKELFIGLAIGYTSTFLFTAFNFAARLIDVEMGFGMVDLVDPMSNEQVTTLGQLWVIVFTIFLLLINGHYFFLLAVQKSFEVVPVNGLDLQAGPLAEHFIDMVGMVFVLALKIAAPIYIALFMTEMALGVVARTVPQINIFFVGLPMKIVVGLGTAMIVLPMIATMFKKVFEGLIDDIWTVLYLMA